MMVAAIRLFVQHVKICAVTVSRVLLTPALMHRLIASTLAELKAAILHVLLSKKHAIILVLLAILFVWLVVKLRQEIALILVQTALFFLVSLRVMRRQKRFAILSVIVVRRMVVIKIPSDS